MLVFLAWGTAVIDRGIIMWLVLYVATIASLSALSLLPTTLAPMPIKTDENRTPYIDM
jgi:hypothetical protein